MERALDKVVVKLDIGTSSPDTLIYRNNSLTHDQPWPLPNGRVRDFRAYRKNQDINSPCIVFKSLQGSDVTDNPFDTKIILPLFFVPYTAFASSPQQYEYLVLKFRPATDPYRAGNSLRSYDFKVNAGASGPYIQPPTTIGPQQSGSDDTVENIFKATTAGIVPFSFKIYGTAGDTRTGVDFGKGHLFSGQPGCLPLQLSDGRIMFSHVGDQSIDPQGGIDFFARSFNLKNLQGADFSFISFGVGFGVIVPPDVASPKISFPIGSTRYEFPIDNELLVRIFQSPRLANSSPADTKAEWILEITGLSAQAFAQFWNEHVAKPHLAAIDTIDAARGLSFMPRFTVPANEDNGRFGFAWLVTQQDTSSTAYEKFTVDKFIGAFAADNSNFAATATFDKLRGRDGKPFTRSVKVSLAGSTIAGNLYDALTQGRARDLTVSLAPSGTVSDSDANPTVARVGALDLSLAHNGHLAGTIKLDIQSLATSTKPFVNIDLEQGLAHVKPGGQDPVPDSLLAEDILSDAERAPTALSNPCTARFLDAVTRAAPIVVSEGELSVDNSSKILLLDGQELTDAGRSRNVVVRLRAVDEASLAAGGSQPPSAVSHAAAAAPPAAPPPRAAPVPQPLRVVIIDPEPFLVAAVDVPPLLDSAAFGDDTDGEFAIYRMSEQQGQGWSLSNIPSGFDFYLPPQGVGEAMEKGKPWPAITDDTNPTTIDYRLSPTARFWLADREQARRYDEAPWNLRRRFGNPGDKAPGSEVAGMRAEFLYGLAMQLRGDFLRLAELGSRIGALQPNLAAREGKVDTPPGERLKVFNDYRHRWARIGKAYNTRLAYLQPWQEGTAGPLIVEDGAAFRLRTGGDQGDYAAANMRNPIDPTATVGIAGGATWAFESNNVYQETIKDPYSTGGRVTAPAFSALGGFGKLTAEFAQGKTRIGAEVAFGRTHRYVVERIGRIGMVWNRAKHVIVYERTVLPTHQFSGPDYPMHQGRPVVRIVEEYVELLQPERAFADQDAPPVRRGPAEACVFKTIKIPVDGRHWGRDIPEGWIVPLWRPDADQSIYPKPAIAIRLTATADAAEPSVLATATQPDRLLFFTSTRAQDDANTDLWAPVPAVDFVNAPRPAGLGLAASNSDDLDATVPDDIAEDPAYAAVTIPIDTGGRHVRLSAGRIAEDGLGAELHNLTFMRAAPATAPASGTQHGAGDSIVHDLQSQVAAVPRALAAGKALLAALPNSLATIVRNQISAPLGSWKDNLKKAIGQEADSVKAQLGKLAADAKAAIPADTSAQWIAPGVQACTAEANRLSGLIKSITARLNQAIGDAQKAALDDIQTAQASANNAWAQQKDALKSATASNFAAVQTIIQSLWPELDTLNGLVVDKSSNSLTTFGRNLDKNISDEATRLKGLVAAAAAQGADLAVRANNLVTRVEQSGNTIVDRSLAFLGSLPKQIRLAPDKTDTIQTQLANARQAMDRFAATARSVIADTASTPQTIAAALTDQINNAASSLTTCIDGLIATAIANVNASISAANSKLSPPAHDALDAISKFADKLEAQITGLLGKFDDIHADFDFVKKAVTDAANELTKLVSTVSNIGSDVVNQITTQFCGLLTDVVDTVSKDVGTVITALNDQIDGFQAEADSAVDAARDWADGLVDSLGNDVDTVVSQLTDAIAARAGGFAQQALGMADDLQSGLAEGLGRVAAAPTFQNPESTLNLIRAAGHSPLVPNFNFNRDRIAYIFDDFQEAVRTSPMAGLVNRAGADLKALGMRVPTEQLAERIVPAALQNFDISKIFPDLAGFKLDGLFSGFKLPSIAQDNVIVTHGFDRASQSAWVKATSNVPLAGAVDVFSFGPLRLSILSGNFSAEADVVATVQGAPQSTANAVIVGDWQLGFSGINLVTFEQTRIVYDSKSGLKIDISPQRIRMDQAIQFLSDMIRSLSDPDSGLVLELERDSRGNPIGVRAGLDLPLPPVASGAFAASGIRLSASTALVVAGGDFSVEVAAGLGRPDEPFTILIAFLNGGGYLVASSRYTPSKHLITAQVVIAIVAGVGADFTFGVARGSVYIQVGAQATFMTPGSGLTLEVFILIRGGVTILSLITINLVVRLGITYNSSDGSVEASGHISVSIKISVFFTKHVDVPIHYHLAGHGSSGGNAGGGASAQRAIAAHAAAAAAIGPEPPGPPPAPPHYLDLFA
jgi:hypothetical protein